MKPSEATRGGNSQSPVEVRLPEGEDGIDGRVLAPDAAAAPPMAHEQARAGCAGNSLTLPAGQYPDPPVKRDIDSIGSALERVQTFLILTDEHRANFEAFRHTDQEFAAGELRKLRDSAVQGMIHLQRLSELILTGYVIDPDKCLPESLCRGSFSSYLGRLLDREPESPWKRAMPDRGEDRSTLPPGEHPFDPYKKDLDPVGFALHRIQTFFVWILEHRATYEKLRRAGKEDAESELSNLRNSIVQGMIHLQRLSELVLAGYTVGPNKRLPESLSRGWFASWVRRLREGEGKRGDRKKGRS